MQATSIRIRHYWLPADRTTGGTDRLSSTTSRDLAIESVFEGFAIIRKSIDHELGSAILGPRCLILPHSDGSLFAVTGGGQSFGADTQIDEEIFDRFCALLANPTELFPSGVSGWKLAGFHPKSPMSPRSDAD